MNKLSDNQENWCKQLQNAVNKMDEIKTLPYNVIQINLFGSASRGKSDPHDLDLILIVKDELTMFAQIFREIYRHYLRNRREIGKDVYESVEKQLREVVVEQSNSDKDPIELIVQVGMEICHQWYPKLTWDWFDISFSGSDFGNFDKVMNRLVFSRYGVKPYAVKKETEEKAFGIPDTVKQFEIWSPQRKDIRKNYLEIVSRSTLKNDIIEELNDFINQIEAVNKYMLKISKVLGLKWNYIRTHPPKKNDSVDDLKWKIAKARRGLKVADVFNYITGRFDGNENIDDKEILAHWNNPWQLCNSITALSKADAKVETKKACLECFEFNPIMAGDGSSDALDVETFSLLFYGRPYDYDKDNYE